MIYACKENMNRRSINRTISGKEQISANRYNQKLAIADTSLNEGVKQSIVTQRLLNRKARVFSFITCRGCLQHYPDRNPENQLSNSYQTPKSICATVHHAKTSSATNNLERTNNIESKMVSRSIKSENKNNTISNSSLQDMDETEFSSTDLVKYMKEINGGLT